MRSPLSSDERLAMSERGISSESASSSGFSSACPSLLSLISGSEWPLTPDFSGPDPLASPSLSTLLLSILGESTC